MRRNEINLISAVFAFFLIFCCQKAAAQYGLEFASHERELDKRTSLSIGEKEAVTLFPKTELSFDLQFKPYQHDYFGYIFRIILNDKLNIDLIYDRRPGIGNHFKLVVGDKFTDIAFNIPGEQLFYKWNPIKLVMDKDKNQLIFTCQGKTYHYSVMLNGFNKFQTFFGLSNYKQFQSSDLPPMRIKDLRIKDGQHLEHHWKLDQATGLHAEDAVGKIKGGVSNPFWIKRQRQEWRMENDYEVSGQANVTFDPKRECVYVVSEDSLVRTFLGSRSSNSWAYQNAPLHIADGSQSLFDPHLGQVHCISIDQKIVSTFDTLSRTWSKPFTYPSRGTNYLSFNKFYSPKDSSIYMVGGYGHFHYQNSVHKYHVPTQQWDSLAYTGDRLFPHYLGALGFCDGKVYLLGGYGSNTGDQMLNPRISNDLMQMDLLGGKFKKINEITFPDQNAVWASSLAVGPGQQLFGLMFPKNKFKSSLQLVSVSLDGQELQELGSMIPFDFHDIKSFADLFYSPASNRYVAVTLYFDSESNKSRVRIYSLLAPAMSYELDESSATSGTKNWVWYASGAVSIAACFILLLQFKGRRRQEDEKEKHEELFPSVSEEPQQLPIAEATVPIPAKEEICSEDKKSAIYLFRGDIQIINAHGDEITKQFSPLLKELFTLFVVYTIYRGRGISSEKLVELFWSDKSSASANNNRSVNIAKINSLLESVGDVKISKKSGYWCLDGSEQICIDFAEYMKILQHEEKLDRVSLSKLLHILDKGSFLFETDYEWLDVIKDEISIHTTTILNETLRGLALSTDAEFIVEIANRIFHFDSVHEEAMVYKCKALVQLGYHSLAHQCFENFCQVYQQLYGESYGKSYREII